MKFGKTLKQYFTNLKKFINFKKNYELAKLSQTSKSSSIYKKQDHQLKKSKFSKSTYILEKIKGKRNKRIKIKINKGKGKEKNKTLTKGHA